MGREGSRGVVNRPAVMWTSRRRRGLSELFVGGRRYAGSGDAPQGRAGSRQSRLWWLGGYSEQGEGSSGVAGGVAERLGDVGVPGLAVCAGGEVAQAGHDPGRGAGAGSGLVFFEGDVAD